MDNAIHFTQFVKRLWLRIDAHNCIGKAAEISYFFVLALFPAFIVLAALVSYLPVTGLWNEVLGWITRFFPLDARPLILQTVGGLTRGRLSFLSIGFGSAAWTVSSGIEALIEGLDTAYEARETRSYLRRRGLALVMVFVFSFLLLTSFGLATAGEWLGRWVNFFQTLGTDLDDFWNFARWAVSLALLALCVEMVYYILPDVKRPWRWLTPGGLFVVVTWIPGTLAFNTYLRHFSSYSRTYGTLGAIFIFMIWLYLISLLVLIGAEIDSEMDHVHGRRGAPAAASRASP
ncbi:MAG TPA: YihY/virulence factor BrkB family protein [Terriglobia bacterium]|nr:YihY/virulence factor BrkB family protein [Terriglobia bacterium]